MFNSVKGSIFAGSSSGSLQHIADAGTMGSGSLEVPLVGHHAKSRDHLTASVSMGSLHGSSHALSDGRGVHGGGLEEGEEQDDKMDVRRLFQKLNWCASQAVQAVHIGTASTGCCTDSNAQQMGDGTAVDKLRSPLPRR